MKVLLDHESRRCGLRSCRRQVEADASFEPGRILARPARKGDPMIKVLALLPVLMLTACGVADTGAAAATEAAARAQELRAGQRAEARVQQQLDAAYQQAAEQRKAAEAASQ
jgi:hypothetical protein